MPMPPAGTEARCYCRKCLEALIAAAGVARPVLPASAERVSGNPLAKRATLYALVVGFPPLPLRLARK